METRVALIGIIVEDKDETEKLNAILHEYGEYLIGRMGIPHTNGGVALISIAIDAPADIISTVAGKIGMLKGISSKVIYASNGKKC